MTCTDFVVLILDLSQMWSYRPCLSGRSGRQSLCPGDARAARARARAHGFIHGPS